MPVAVWDPAKAATLKDNDAAALFSIGASMRGRVQEQTALDISGLSTAARLERSVLGYVTATTSVLGGLMLLLSLTSQVRIMMMDAELSALNVRLGDVTEIEGNTPDALAAKIDKLQTDVKTLSALIYDTDYLAPKLHAINERIPAELWVTNIQYSGPFAASEMQTSGKRNADLSETALKGEQGQAGGGTKGLRNSPEFKVFAPPLGDMGFNLEGGAAGQGAAYDGDQGNAVKSTGFTIQCTVRRKS